VATNAISKGIKIAANNEVPDQMLRQQSAADLGWRNSQCLI